MNHQFGSWTLIVNRDHDRGSLFICLLTYTTIIGKTAIVFYCCSLHLSKFCPSWERDPSHVSLSEVSTFPPVNRFFWGVFFSLLLLRVKYRGCCTFMPSEADCDLWLWVKQIKLDSLRFVRVLTLQLYRMHFYVQTKHSIHFIHSPHALTFSHLVTHLFLIDKFLFFARPLQSAGV